MTTPTTARPLLIPAAVRGLSSTEHDHVRLKVGTGVFVGPRDQAEKLHKAIGEHADRVAADRVAAALEAAREDEYERWLPVLERPSHPKYLDAGVIPAHVRDRFDVERAGAA